MSCPRRFFALLPALVWTAGALAAGEGAGDASSEPFRAERTQARLVAQPGSVRPGEPFRVGLLFDLA